MSDSYNDTHQSGRNYEGTREVGRGGFRGGRGSGNRDQGGFRIRLSDNEMRAARALQEAFNLRSTVAVLGFALRTLAQMLEEGKLDEILTTYRAQDSRGNNRKEDNFNSKRRNKFDQEDFGERRGPKPNPFERPSKPETNSNDSIDKESSSVEGEELNTEDKTDELQNESSSIEDLNTNQESQSSDSSQESEKSE